MVEKGVSMGDGAFYYLVKEGAIEAPFRTGGPYVMVSDEDLSSEAQELADKAAERAKRVEPGCGAPGCPYCWHDVDPVDDSDLELDDPVDDVGTTQMAEEAKTLSDEHVDELDVQLAIAKAAQRNVYAICDMALEASEDGEREIVVGNSWIPGSERGDDDLSDVEYADDIEYLEIQLLEDAGFAVEASNFAVTDVRYTKTIRW